MIHPTADVSPDAKIGSGTRVWNDAQIRERAIVGEDRIQIYQKEEGYKDPQFNL